MLVALPIWMVPLAYAIIYFGVWKLRGCSVGLIDSLTPGFNPPNKATCVKASTAGSTVGDVASATVGARGTGLTSDICQNPPTLVRSGIVRLTPQAMAAFKAAQAAAGGRIVVVSSYRDCALQRIDCLRICGNPNGCAGRCAAPGQSCHQYGEAVDVSNWQFALPYLTAHGFRHPLPSSDPGHFSLSGGRCPGA